MNKDERAILKTVAKASRHEWREFLINEGDAKIEKGPPKVAEPFKAMRAGQGRPGRPEWPHELFLKRYSEAVKAALPSLRAEDRAANFRALDGTLSLTTRHFRRLCAKHRVSAGPE